MYLILVRVIKALIGVYACTADLYMIINVDEMDKGNEQEGINVVNVNKNVAGLGNSGTVAVDEVHHGLDLDHVID